MHDTRHRQLSILQSPEIGFLVFEHAHTTFDVDVLGMSNETKVKSE